MPTITDNFNRANGALASPWVLGNGENILNIVSNTVQESSGADGSAIYDVGTTWGNDQSSKSTLSVTGTGGGGAGGGFYVRHAVSARTGYRWVIDHATTNNAELARFNGGTFTSLDVRTQAFTNGDVFELRATGSVGAVAIEVYRNGSLAYTVNDTSGSGIGSGKPGLAYSSTETLVTWDDWTGTDSFTTPASLTGTVAGVGSADGALSAGVTYMGAGVAVTAASGDVTAGYPAGLVLATNDVIVCDVSARDNVSLTFPGGWTKKAELNNGTGLRKTVAWKRRAGGDSDVNVAVTHTAGAQIIARVHVIRGAVTSGDPFESQGGPTAVSAATTGAFPSATTVSDGDLLFYTMAYGDDYLTVPSITNAQGLTLTERGLTEVT